MVKLYRCEDDKPLGAISPDELDFLVNCLEEEDSEDTDYFVDRDTLDFLRDEGASAAILTALEGALGDRTGVDFYYVDEDAVVAAEDTEEA